MDFHSLTRRELQTLCKKNKIPANITNIAMADALSDLQYVEGLDELMMNEEKVGPQTPSIPRNVSRIKDPETAEPLTRSRRTTTRRAVLDQGNKKNVAETPVPAASSTTSRTRGRKAQVDSSVPVRTRQSVRLLEKTMAELSLKDSKTRTTAPVVKMDSLDQTVEEYHHVSDKVLQNNNEDGDDDDKKKANKDEIVTANASGDARCVGDKVSDEIFDKVMDAVDEEADQRDQIIASQQSADSNQLSTKSIAADSQKPLAIQQDEIFDKVMDAVDEEADQRDQLIVSQQLADSNQLATKSIAADAPSDTDADDDIDSDSQKPLAIQQDEISDKVMDAVDEEADQRDQLIASQQSADSNQLATKSIAADAPSDTDADDDIESDSQKPLAIQQDILLDDEADSHAASKESAVDNNADDDDSDSQKFVATNEQQDNAVSNQSATESVVDTSADDVSDSQNSIANQQGNLIDEAVPNQFATESIVDKGADDDSNSQNFVANQQGNHIAEAVSNQFATESTVDTDTDDDSDSQNSVANRQGKPIAEADSKQFSTKSVVDTEADNDSDSQKSVSNQQDIDIAEADSNIFATESIAAAAETDADSSASDTDADDDSGSQKSISDQLDKQTTEAECIEELFDVSLIEAYEDEIPNSNSVKKQISPSSPPSMPPSNDMENLSDIYVMLSSKEFSMASSPAAIAKQRNDCDSSGPGPTESAVSNQKLTALIQADNKENIDSSGMILIMKDEKSTKKDKMKKKRNNINIVEDDSELKSLKDKSLRQLNKMLKEKLQIYKKNNEEQNITAKKQVPRPALQTLPENLMLAGEPKNEN